MKKIVRLFALPILLCALGIVLVGCGKNTTKFDVYIADSNGGLIYFSVSKDIEELEVGKHSVKKKSEIVVRWASYSSYEATLYINNAPYTQQTSPVALTITKDTRIQVLTTDSTSTSQEDYVTFKLIKPTKPVCVRNLNAFSGWSGNLYNGSMVEIGEVFEVSWDMYNSYTYNRGVKFNVAGAELISDYELGVSTYAQFKVTGEVKLEITEIEVARIRIDRPYFVSVRDTEDRAVHKGPNGTYVELGKPFSFRAYSNNRWEYIATVVAETGIVKTLLSPDANGWYTIPKVAEDTKIYIVTWEKTEVYFEGLFTSSLNWADNYLGFEVSQNGKSIGYAYGDDYLPIDAGTPVSFSVELSNEIMYTHFVDYVAIRRDDGAFSKIQPNANGIYSFTATYEEDIDIRVYVSEREKHLVNFKITGGNVDYYCLQMYDLELAMAGARWAASDSSIHDGDMAYTGYMVVISLDDFEYGKQLKSVKINGIELTATTMIYGADVYMFTMGDEDVKIEIELENATSHDVSFIYDSDDVSSIFVQYYETIGGYIEKYLETTGENANKIVGMFDEDWVEFHVELEAGKKIVSVTVNGQEVFFDSNGNYEAIVNGETIIEIITA